MMSVSNIVQVISLLVVVVALLLSFRQNFITAKQAQEAVRQSTAAASSLHRESVQGMMQHVLDFTYNAMVRDPHLLSWFLASRGFPKVNRNKSNVYLFLWMRLGLHQSHYFEWVGGLITDEVWLYWRNAVQLDVASPGFEAVWQTVRNTFTRGFVECIEELRAANSTAKSPEEVMNNIASRELPIFTHDF
jgi:hypothetical protein